MLMVRRTSLLSQRFESFALFAPKPWKHGILTSTFMLAIIESRDTSQEKIHEVCVIDFKK